MHKKGQFFIIAAIIIVVIIASLGTIYISTKTVPKEDKQVYDLSREIDFESNKVIDYGVFNAKTTTDKSGNLTRLMEYYSETNPDTDLIMIYGNETGITKALLYKKRSSGQVCVGEGCMPLSDIEPINILGNITITSMSGGKIKQISLDLGGKAPLEFELNPGDNFFVVLKKQVEEEEIVATE